MGVESVVGSCPLLRGFSGFASSTKTNISEFLFDLEAVDEKPLYGHATSHSQLFDLIIYLFVILEVNSCLSFH